MEQVEQIRRARCTYDLFLAILVARYQVDRFHMSGIHLVPEDIREDYFGQVLFLLISVEAAIYMWKAARSDDGSEDRGRPAVTRP